MNEPPDNQSQSRRRSGRYTLFAHRDAIQEQVNQGMSLVSIYDAFSEELGVTYSQFARYVGTYISKPEKVSVGKPKAPKTPDRPPIFNSASMPQTFTVNRNPKKEDFF